ncbi:signal peptidase II [Oricola sp.]|uniref:signal peptidase II n=1 Tax=Oricola sp. TaxID=1979950 RepID=UPI00260091C6|nr:signal peptidase II [Oricola sp.]MCI5077911.1 signal peptidase II [Oricola sp.]
MKRLLPAATTIGLIVAADRVSKLLVERFMDYQETIDLLPFFALYRTHNQGIAFSMLWGLGALPLIAISLAVIAFVLWLWRSSPAERVVSHVGFALVIGGAIGNLIDRAMFGYVIDYFLFHTSAWSFAVFNLADSAITVGAGLIILDEVLTWRRERAIENAD